MTSVQKFTAAEDDWVVNLSDDREASILIQCYYIATLLAVIEDEEHRDEIIEKLPSTVRSLRGAVEDDCAAKGLTKSEKATELIASLKDGIAALREQAEMMIRTGTGVPVH
jgi:hypothetical protein